MRVEHGIPNDMNYKRLLSAREWYTICILTIGVILVNYISYYADDLIFAYQEVPHRTFVTEVLQLLSYPVYMYVAVFEKSFFIDIFLIGRVVNYLIETTYFFVLTFCAYLPFRALFGRLD